MIPAPSWVSYPDMVLLCGRRAGGGAVQPERRLQAAPGGPGTPRSRKNTKWLILEQPCNPSGAAYSWAEMQAITDVLKKHEHVWVLTDDMYEKLVYARLRVLHPGGGRAVAGRAHADHERRLQGLRHDRLADRLRRRAEPVDQGDGEDPVAVDLLALLDQPGGGGGGAEQPRTSSRPSDEVFRQRRDLVVEKLNQCPGLSCAKPEGAF
ncbi:MAG: aminotransferase class I/II-fold pyridoxal phosphate-dependent enzyme [Xanthomonadales bacterium]|nr:aminotransferase class I/II-fold pyridoxal phosphate-dependent enzyme [Xanthomonadales bacterium]